MGRERARRDGSGLEGVGTAAMATNISCPPSWTQFTYTGLIGLVPATCSPIAAYLGGRG